MVPSLHILGSSSSGNAALLDTGETRILIDCGLSGRRLTALCKDCGIPVDTIEAVFLTHEHQDHAGGVRGLSRHRNLEFITNRETADCVRERVETPVRWRHFAPGSSLRIRDLEIECWQVPHDAVNPVAFSFRWGGSSLFAPSRQLVWVLDLGYVPEALGRGIASSDIVVIEANHDEAMLEANPNRPWSLKQRVRGRHGHLSNREAFEALAIAPDSRWQQLCLVHLSRDCNDPSLVKDTFAPLCEGRPGRGIEVIPPDATDPVPVPLCA